jgi:predicted permease
MLVALALTAGLLLGWLTIPVLATSLPDGLRLSTQNPISLDLRVVWFTAGLAAIAWLLASLPPVISASRSNLVSLLKTEDRSSAVSAASGRLRRWLTVAEVALAVTLISGGVLYARSYQRLLAVEKGFDSHGLAEVSLSMPASFFHADNSRAQFTERFTHALAAVPGVQGITNSSPPPSMGDSPSSVTVEVDGRVVAEPLLLGRKYVDADFFRVVGLPLKRGRLLQPGDPDTNVVIGESLARRLWPDGNAVDRTLRGVGNSGFATNGVRVVGVVGDFRTAATRLPDPSDSRMHVYTSWPTRPAGAQAGTKVASPPLDTGGSWSFATMTVRLDSADRLSALLTATRRLEPGLEATVTLVDDLYARQNSNTQLARQVVGAFSALAFLIAIVGVYGVMAFLVAGRRREIGIRMALGAGRRDISRLILGSSLRLVLAGAVIGSLGALVASQWIKAQLFGTSPTDPVAWVVVVLAVLVVSVLGTWHPVREAARVDPAVTLRTE